MGGGGRENRSIWQFQNGREILKTISVERYILFISQKCLWTDTTLWHSAIPGTLRGGGVSRQPALPPMPTMFVRGSVYVCLCACAGAGGLKARKMATCHCQVYKLPSDIVRIYLPPLWNYSWFCTSHLRENARLEILQWELPCHVSKSIFSIIKKALWSRLPFFWVVCGGGGRVVS